MPTIWYLNLPRSHPGPCVIQRIPLAASGNKEGSCHLSRFGAISSIQSYLKEIDPAIAGARRHCYPSESSASITSRLGTPTPTYALTDVFGFRVPLGADDTDAQ